MKKHNGDAVDLLSTTELEAIVKACIRGLSQAGLSPKQITKKRTYAIAGKFIEDVAMARLTEEFLREILNSDLLITGVTADGEVTFAYHNRKTRPAILKGSPK